MKVAVIGAGFVGLTTALGLCEIGHVVDCVDIDQGRCDQLNKGYVPFFEPGIDELLAKHLDTGSFRATSSLREAMVDADVSIICVGTPSTERGIDLTAVREAARTIGENLSKDLFHVVVVKSTVVPGSVDSEVCAVLESTTNLVAGVDFGLAMNPEFLREGCAVADFMTPDRIVIGADDKKTATILRRMYAEFTCPVIETSTRNAEMIKYASNAVLATLISYANEIASICEQVTGLSEEVVMNGLFEDRRFWCRNGTNDDDRLRPGLISYLRGGVGFGGSCFPKDVQALRCFAKQVGQATPMLDSVLAVNEQRAVGIVKRLKRELDGNLEGKRIAILGVAFKPETDDIRESPSLRIMKHLNAEKAEIVMHDPLVSERDVKQATGFKNISSCESVEEALIAAHAAVIATAWDDYAAIDWSAMAVRMANKIILDGRQVIPDDQHGKGFVLLRTGSASSVKSSFD